MVPEDAIAMNGTVPPEMEAALVEWVSRALREVYQQTLS